MMTFASKLELCCAAAPTPGAIVSENNRDKASSGIKFISIRIRIIYFILAPVVLALVEVGVSFSKVAIPSVSGKERLRKISHILLRASVRLGGVLALSQLDG